MLRARCRGCANAAGWISVAGNISLAVTKWVIGLTSNSQALIADALHSSVDVLGSCITLIMLRLSKRAPSKRFPYGLGKLEDVAAMAIYLILIGAGTYIVVDAVHSIIDGRMGPPGTLAIAPAILSILINAFMYYFISCAGRQTNSPSLLALGYENKVDAFSSMAALVGIVGAVLGFAPLDPIAAIVVSIIIVTESSRELFHAAQRLTDAALPRSVRVAIERAATTAPYVQGILRVKSRRLGAKAHVDLDILVDAELSVETAEGIAETIAQRVRADVDEASVVRVFLHPADSESHVPHVRLKELITAMGELRLRHQKSGDKL